jgi:hypothetical protein
MEESNKSIDISAKSEYNDKTRLYGIYPDIDDDDFVTRILQKREIADSQQSSQYRSDGSEIGPNPCEQTEFEATPVQRFVANFMAPDTPYMSMLLYHGVGVGKTCAGITVAERWLANYPRRKVFIVAPPSIQAGFKSTIFNASKVNIPENENEPNTVSQCTGDTYMKITTTLYDKNRDHIQYRVNRVIDSRYEFFGYITLKNYIKKLIDDVPTTLDPIIREKQQDRILRTKFSGRLLIIDEAHNIRDMPVIGEDPEAVDAQPDEKSDMQGGKELTPYLMRVLRVAEGLKLLLLTGTPMYNTHNEIVFLMNIINANEKRQLVKDSDLFTPTGAITPKGEEEIARFASRHVSFMRGENPRSFPLRLMPLNRQFTYPPTNPVGVPIPDADKIVIEKLPIVPSQMTGDIERDYSTYQEEITKKKGGMSPIMLETLVQAGNFIWPKTTEDTDIINRIGFEGFMSAFESIKEEAVMARGLDKKDKKIIRRKYKPRGDDGGAWMANLMQISPKCARVISSVSSADGVCFIYSRFVQSGALPIALFLESVGFLPYGRDQLLLGGPRHPEGPLCFCGRRQHTHGQQDHNFTQARYALLTGDRVLTPKVDTLVRASQMPENKNGSIIKVIIGSQIAAEGIDLRYIRETHIFDSWFHLNKTEQIIGRSIRFCSHTALPEQKRNATIFLHINEFSNIPKETADLYCYRLAYKKAIKVGNVSRLIKANAVDCNLTHPLVVLSGYPTLVGDKRPIDSHGNVRDGVTINDMPFTAICDWLDTCDFKCSTQILKEAEIDDMTYTAYAAGWKEARMKQVIRTEFSDKLFIRYENLAEMFGNIPLNMIIDLLKSIIGNKSFIVHHKGRQGYLIYRNKYLIFQPIAIIDTKIPMAMRAAHFPVKRDDYDPMPLEITKIEEKPFIVEKVKASTISGWIACKKFIFELRNNPNALVPVELDEYIITLAGGDQKQASTYTDKIKTIRFLASVMPRKQEYIDALTNIFIEYLWDFWFSSEWKAENWKIAFADIPEALRDKYLVENIMHIETIELYRYFDMTSASIKYLCNGTPCPIAIVDQIRRMPDIFSGELTPVTTGSIYGFITYKKDQAVFKTNTPPLPGEKLGPGRECENDTKTSSHKVKIYEAMNYLKDFLKTDMGINEPSGLLGSYIVNPAQTCTLLELLLRFMDEMEINGKRWFYRAIESSILGHKGRK